MCEKTTVTAYISGGMTLVPDHEALFAAEHQRLEGLGYVVVDPSAINDAITGRSYESCMRHDLALLLVDIDVCVMLPGWETSRGAVAERMVAQVIGLTVYDDPIEVPAVGTPCGAVVRPTSFEYSGSLTEVIRSTSRGDGPVR